MSEERKPPTKISTQRVIGGVLVLLGILSLALPFWINARISETAFDVFEAFTPVFSIGTALIVTGLYVLALWSKRGVKPPGPPQNDQQHPQ